MRHPLPLSIPEGYKVAVTQPFGDKSNVDWYHKNGLNIDSHNGVDLIIVFEGCTRPQQMAATYGTKIVSPVPAHLDQKWWTTPLSSQGNGVQVSWRDGVDKISMRTWHCSEVYAKPNYEALETLGLIGNSGLVWPAPNNACVLCGSHLHLMTYKNGTLVDPETIFDYTKWHVSEDTGVEKDLAPFFHFLGKIKDMVFSFSK